jgi:multiple sugar transport system substrate-binding protein
MDVYNDVITPKANAWAGKNNLTMQFVNIPYADFQTKDLTSFATRDNAPDMFLGVVSYWAGAANVAEPVPDALAKRLESEVVPAIAQGFKMGGKWMGLSAGGVPGLGPMLIWNPDDFTEVGLDPTKPPPTMDQMLEYARKLVKRDASGNITRSGFAMRYDGALGLGIGTKFFPFLDAFGGKMYDPPTGKADGVANSPETIAAVEYVTNYTQGEKLASTTLGVPEMQFGQRQASMFFREGHMIGWIPTNYPGVNFEFAPIPKAKQDGMGLHGLDSWAPLVYKFGPRKDLAWAFLDQVLYRADLELAACMHKSNQAVPAFKVNWDTDYFKNRMDNKVLAYAMDHVTSPVYMHPKTAQLADRFAQGVQEATLGKNKPKDAMDSAAKDMTAILTA